MYKCKNQIRSIVIMKSAIPSRLIDNVGMNSEKIMFEVCEETIQQIKILWFRLCGFKEH